MIVKNTNTYNHIDYKHPIAECNDLRSAYYRGHSAYPIPQRTTHLENKLNPVDATRNYLPVLNYSSENASQYKLKFPINYGDRAERTYTSTVPQFNQSLFGKLRNNPPTRINMFQSIQQRDYTPPIRIVDENHFKFDADYIIPSRTEENPRIDHPESWGHAKHLDIYVPTTMQDFVPHTNPQKNSIAKKDQISVWDWLEMPKTSKGFGLKETPTARADIHEPIYDRKERFQRPIYQRLVRNSPKFLPNFGISSEMRSNFTAPVEMRLNLEPDGMWAIPIAAGQDRTGKTEYEMYGSGMRVDKIIDQSKII